MHQGWPKLALHAIQQTDKGLVIAHLLPVSAEAEIDGKPVSIRVESDYPFRMNAQITVETQQSVVFELKLRLPAWAKTVRLNDRPIRIRQGHFKLERVWDGKKTLRLELKAAPQFVSRPTGLKTVEYGPLVFSLPIQTEYCMREYIRNDVERRFPYCDYELIPKSPWNYGFADAELTVEEREVDEVPFSSVNPPVVIHAQLAPVEWEWADGFDTVPAVKPAKNVTIGAAESIALVPYGCAKLRMTEMPRLRKKG